MSNGPDTRDLLDFRIEVAERLSAIETRLEAIDKKLDGTSNVVSGITTDRSELKGAWKALAIVVSGLIAFASLFAWLWENVFSNKGHS